MARAIPALPACPAWLKWGRCCGCCGESFYRNTVRLRILLIASMVLILACCSTIGKMCQVFFFCVSLEGEMDLHAAAVVLLLVPFLCYLVAIVSDSLLGFVKDSFHKKVLVRTRRHIILICSSLLPGGVATVRVKNAVDAFVLVCTEAPWIVAVISTFVDGAFRSCTHAYFNAALACTSPLFFCYAVGETCMSCAPSVAAKFDALTKVSTDWYLGSSLGTGGGEEDWNGSATTEEEEPSPVERWTSIVLLGPLQRRVLFLLSCIALLGLNVLFVGIHRNGVAGLVLFLAVPLGMGQVRRIFVCPVGPLYKFLVYSCLVFSLAFLLLSAVSMREQDATTIGTRLVGGANYTEVRRPGTYPICERRWGNASLPEERRLAALDVLLLADALYEGSAASIDGYVRGGTEGTALADVERTDLEAFSAVARMAVFRFPSIKVQVLSVRGTQVTKEVLKDIDLFIMSGMLQLTDAFMPVLFLLSDEQVQNFMYYLSVYQFIDDPTVEKVVSKLQDLKAGGDSEGYTTTATGHSLGGTLAAAAAIQVGAPAVVFSTPGLVFNAKLFGIDHEGIRTDIFHVQPATDLLATIDVHVGQVQKMACAKRSSLDCHLSPTTTCELFRNCGDPRGRVLGGPGYGAAWCGRD